MNINEITKELQKYIDELQAKDITPTIDQMNNHLGKIVDTENSNSIEDFSGISPIQMQSMLYTPFENDCCVQINELSENDLPKSSILRQAKHLLSLLTEHEIKLTKVGNIPPKIVKELYSIGIPEHFIETGVFNLNKETDSEVVQFLRFALRDCGFIKVRLGKISLTKVGTKALADLNKLNHAILKYAMTSYNAAYFDTYDNENIGNIGRVFSLWLLHHYGNDWHEPEFYNNLYNKAFPTLQNSNRIYEVRLFSRLFNYLGLIEVEYKQTIFGINKIKKSPLLDILFRFEEPE